MKRDFTGNGLGSEFIPSEQESLWSMATIRKSDSGLPVNIWVDDGMTYKRSGHGKRIKFQPDRGDHPVTGNFASITISDNPEVIGEHNLSEREIRQLREFVIKNRDILEQLSDMEIGIREFFERFN